MNCNAVRNKIVTEIQKVVDIAVLGLSGGADSLLVALLMKDALGPINVHVLSMPWGEIDEKEFNSASARFAKHLKLNHESVSIGKVTDDLNNLIKDLFSENLTHTNAGNTRARIRMCLLYSYVHHLGTKNPEKRVRVIGTGNLSEDYIGYDTKGGDALADIFPIGQLFKSEVYKMLEYYRDRGDITEDMINREPSAGLWDGQTDEEELGFSYSDMECAIHDLLFGAHKLNRKVPFEIRDFVESRHKNNKHKHEAPPVIKLRDSRGDFIGE